MDDPIAKENGVDTLRKKLADLYESKEYSDAALKVKDKEFKAHKWVLADQSPVFHNIFEKATKKNTDVFDFSDCDPNTFEKLLEYLYLGKTETGNMWSDGNFLELTKIADKFGINDLRSDCIISMMSDLNVENVCQVAALACSIGDRPLEIKCQDFFNENGGEIVSTPEWDAFVKDNSLLACKLLTNMLKEMKSKK